MKFKYYLRGVGIGIIFSTIILSIAFARFRPTLSAEEIRKEAYKLGMVDESNQTDEDEANEEISKTDGGDKNLKEDDNSEANMDTPDESNEDVEDDKKENKIKITIKGGEYSDVVSEHLKEAGLIKDAEKYNRWLMKNGYDSKIQPGVYSIKKGSSYKEIAEIITEHED